MRKRICFIFFALVISGGFLWLFSSSDYSLGANGQFGSKTLIGDKEFNEFAKGYIGSYEGIIEGKAYGVDLDWIWLDPGVTFQKYKGLTLIFENWTAGGGVGMGRGGGDIFFGGGGGAFGGGRVDRFNLGYDYVEALKIQFATDSNVRGAFKNNIQVVPHIDVLQCQADKYIKPDFLILKGGLVEKHPSAFGREALVVEMVLVDAKDYRVVGKIVHKKYGYLGRGPHEDFAKETGNLLTKHIGIPTNMGAKLTEYDRIKDILSPGKVKEGEKVPEGAVK